MTTYLKIILPIYLILFFGLALFWRSYIAWMRTGVNPYKLGNDNTVHDFVGKLFRLTLLISVLIVLAFTFSDKLYEMLVPIPWINLPALVGIGLALLVLALAWVLVAQIQMGDLWRIGVDHQTSSPLVQNGLFSVSRNTSILGVIIILVSMFLILRTAAMLVATTLGIVLIHLQVRLEESFLIERYGKTYRSYLSRVRRWM